MRLPVILMLLTILLLPADLRGLAAQVEAGAETARTAVTKLLDGKDDVKVAEASAKLLPGAQVTQVQ